MTEAISITTGCIALLVLIAAGLVLAIYQCKLLKKQKEYIKKLNDHDKAVILDYLKLDGFKEKGTKK